MSVWALGLNQTPFEYMQIQLWYLLLIYFTVYNKGHGAWVVMTECLLAVSWIEFALGI